jgi:tRNA (cmo5U34)-methyltransferase
MDDQELRNVFDRMASGYDSKSDKIAPIYNGLYFLLESVFAELPQDARLLCVGVGTGTEVLHLASVFPGWSFTAVEPSGAMLDVCRRRVEEAGFSSRCRFREGYVDSLPSDELYDGCLLYTSPSPRDRTRSRMPSSA